MKKFFPTPEAESQKGFFTESLKKFFLFLSKTDFKTMKELEEKPGTAGRDASQTQVSLGIMVLITGVLAFLSGGYALYTTFENWRPAVVAGIVYACLIMAFDRDIVSASDKKATLMRIPLAIFIGFAVALPLEMRLLQGSINQQLRQQEINNNKLLTDRQDDDLKRFREDKEKRQSDVEKFREQVIYWSKMMEAERSGREIPDSSGKAGPGVRFHEAERLKKENENYLDEAKAKLDQHLATRPEILKESAQVYQNRFVSQPTDFLSRYKALETMKRESPDARKISWALRLLFIFFELLPALLKLLAPANGYTTVIQADRAAMIHAINQSTNNQMDGEPQSPPKWPIPALRLPDAP